MEKETIDDKVNDGKIIFGGFKKAVSMGAPIAGLTILAMIGTIAYVGYETKSLLEKEREACGSIEDKSWIHDTSLGRYSCQEIEERYKKLFSE